MGASAHFLRTTPRRWESPIPRIALPANKNELLGGRLPWTSLDLPGWVFWIHLEHITMKTADSGEGWSWAFLGSPGPPGWLPSTHVNNISLTKCRFQERLEAGFPVLPWTPKLATPHHKQLAAHAVAESLFYCPPKTKGWRVRFLRLPWASWVKFRHQ